MFVPPAGLMDAETAAPASSMVAGPSPQWRVAERRNRKVGSGNIFCGVNLWQLQRLFRAAGDQDAEQRAQLVWGRGDEAELAQALIGLRARSRRRGLRTEGRDALGSRWLRAFNHLRIGEGSPSCQGQDPVEGADSEATANGSPELNPPTPAGSAGGGAGAAAALGKNQASAVTPERPARTGPGLRRGGKNDPDRYLHRILH
ncbi:arginine vasopressin-induced protein 1 [Lampris incognitus]|uniref:arginine vasopressin-induced protein 1 n=1 Tax=Lampris incognitus TaxID=2546036 RepID=UPI0024B60D00|nr:arginine vasopressin-induced protein 1 [Lampris incognitus]XP_056147717.1 arginine vasopressin-induced protein 1 [Lampris incognitus]